MVVAIEGRDLPGRQCRPDPSGPVHENVHVAACRRATSGSAPNLRGRTYGVFSPVPGDAEAARWEVDVTIREVDDGLDFGGPFVLGPRGQRHLGLAWGDVSADGSFDLFRGAKLRLDGIDPSLIREASSQGKHLVCRLGLTDSKGNPRCATVTPSDIEWSAELG